MMLIRLIRLMMILHKHKQLSSCLSTRTLALGIGRERSSGLSWCLLLLTYVLGRCFMPSSTRYRRHRRRPRPTLPPRRRRPWQPRPSWKAHRDCCSNEYEAAQMSRAALTIEYLEDLEAYVLEDVGVVALHLHLLLDLRHEHAHLEHLEVSLVAWVVLHRHDWRRIRSSSHCSRSRWSAACTIIVAVAIKVIIIGRRRRRGRWRRCRWSGARGRSHGASRLSRRRWRRRSRRGDGSIIGERRCDLFESRDRGELGLEDRERDLDALDVLRHLPELLLAQIREAIHKLCGIDDKVIDERQGLLVAHRLDILKVDGGANVGAQHFQRDMTKTTTISTMMLVRERQQANERRNALRPFSLHCATHRRRQPAKPFFRRLLCRHDPALSRHHQVHDSWRGW